MKKKVIYLLLSTILIGILYTGTSIIWIKKGKEGFLSWPAKTIFTFFPQSRKVFKHYYAGDLAPNYLRSRPYSKLVIEVDYLEGYKPSMEDLESLVEFVEKYLDKPEGVEVIFSDQIEGGKEEFTLEDVRQLEKKYRSFGDEEETVTLYYLFLSSAVDGQRATAFSGSSIVVFVNHIQRIPEYPYVGHLLKQAVLRHELGHILGLVNLGFLRGAYSGRETGRRFFGVHESFFKSIFREIRVWEQSSHSRNKESVMSIEGSFIIRSQLENHIGREAKEELEEGRVGEKRKIIDFLIEAGHPIEFDRYDIEALEAIRGYSLE